MFLNLDGVYEFIDAYFALLGELAEDVVDDCPSFLGNVVANVGYKQEIVDSALMREVILDDADLLGGQEDSGGIEEEVEGVF